MPNNLANLVNLRTLLLGLKLVKVLPQPVLALTGLEHLSVAFCKLSRVPPELTGMRNLRELHLKGNSGLIVSRPESNFPSGRLLLVKPQIRGGDVLCSGIASDL